MSSFTPSTAQAWALLLVAGLLEIGWAVGMKSTEGFTRWGPSAVLVTALLSFYLLALAMKTLPVGTAYAVWVGIGAAGRRCSASRCWARRPPRRASRASC